ncbi:hypothetical protein B6U66_00850 [Candidatus Bathyarchaeota archaeon ex4484_135]|nr:MAG: hypothetical protein B6U66_00850 [Candidatus Bathyarchaeota archaeon ex4484_135]
MSESEVKEIEESYLSKADWEIHENANTVISYSDFLGYTMSKLLKKPSVLYDYLPARAVEMHFNRDIHIHKLPHSLWVPYCVGWSYAKILRLGLITPSIVSRPAKHLSTAISHVINFFHLTAQEWSGAQAISAIDLYAGPFVEHDRLSYPAVKQEIQKMFFELNYPTRLGYQSAFTNATIMLEADKDLLASEAIIGGREVGQLGDYLDGAIAVARAFFDLSLEGDARGQPFTFPITTLMLSPDFDWNGRTWGDLTDLIFEALARRGTAYLLNGYSTDVGSLYAMCLHADELVVFRRGGEIHVRTIREFFEEFSKGLLERKGEAEWYSIKEPVEMLSLNPETLEVEWVQVKRLLRTRSGKKVVIKIRTGRSFRATPEHPVAVLTREGIEIKRASEVRRGDYVLLLRDASRCLSEHYAELAGMTVDEEFAYFLGLFVADGNYLRRRDKRYKDSKVGDYYYSGLQFSFSEDEKPLIDFVVKFAKERLGREVRIRRDRRYPSTVYLYIYDAKLARALAEGGVSFGREARVPPCIWNSPPSVVRAFIRGFYDGEGYDRDLEIHLNNGRLAQELALLTLMVGIPTTIREGEKSQVLRFCHARSGANRFPRDTVFDRVPWFVVKRKKGMCYHGGMYSRTTLLKHGVYKGLAKALLENDVAVAPVEELFIIKNGEEEYFYDVELERNHYFIHSLGIITHNCCRLTIDFSKVALHEAEARAKEAAEEFREALHKGRAPRGMWAMPDATGSIGVVTINLPRLAALSKGEWDKLEELLMERLEVAREVLRAWRARYERMLEKGLMPMTRIYLGHLAGHFSTIGLVGLPEMASNFAREPRLWLDLDRRAVREAIGLEKKVVRLVKKVAEEYEAEDSCLYNVEEVPAESTAYRFALEDMKLLKEELAKGEVFMPRHDGTPYYSNSIVPYYAPASLPDRIRWEAEVQPEFTGGVMMHIFLDESPDPEALKKLVRRVAERTKVVYFSITPTIAVCRNCGWHAVGLFEKCPRCGHRVELWSRIVGYYRPLSNWNEGKKAEFRQRVHYGSALGLGF